MAKAVREFYLRKNIDDTRVQQIVKYLKDFGHGEVTVERFQREVSLYVYDTRDVELVKGQFGQFIDAEADLTR